MTILQAFCRPQQLSPCGKSPSILHICAHARFCSSFTGHSSASSTNRDDLDRPDVDLLCDDAPVGVVVVRVDDVQVLDVLVDEEVELALAEDVVVAVVGHRAAGGTAATAAAAAVTAAAPAARVRRRRFL